MNKNKSHRPPKPPKVIQWAHINQDLLPQRRTRTTAQWYREHPVALFKAKVQAVLNNADSWTEEKLKKQCRIATTIGMRVGEIIRGEVCEICGKPCRPDAHHDDYKLPLAIRWFCRSCHLHYDQAERDRKGIPRAARPRRYIDYSIYLRAVDMCNSGLCQSEVARILGISYSTCSKWMAGICRPKDNRD